MSLSIPNGWSQIEVEGVAQLHKAYTFKNFVQALAFTNQVAQLAESKNHHPAITTEWGKVTVRWWTHTEKGISDQDIELASLCDSL